MIFDGIRKGDFNNIKWVLNEWGEFPAQFSDNSCRIVSSKYFAKGESSLFTMVARVVDTITKSGIKQGHFPADHDAFKFSHQLANLLFEQHVSFNSPVWFNVGVENNPQCSACFIQSVEDTMEGILDLNKKEGLIFKYGSGTGTNISTLRAKNTPLSKGGVASGPVEFMRMFDTTASVITSGGKTRRAAKMVLMDCDHADISEFIWCKAIEDRKAKTFIEVMETDPYEAYSMVQFQNGNNSVRLTDDFMRKALLCDGSTESRHMIDIAQAAWECGDPGVQFTDTINDANPCPDDFTINASNPCSEYLFCDESACNLASIKLTEYTLAHLEHISGIMIVAMDILVTLSSYPTEEIGKNSEKYRPLGLGFTNLGAYLITKGYAYSSEQGRLVASGISQRMLLAARQQSRKLGELLGSWWDTSEQPLRNAQLTLIAPTGTISFMMDCESTGCEPILAAKQIKNLEGGGTLEIEPQCIKDCPDPSVIETALGDTAITPKAHILMMAAIQPFMSGAISKTVNMPEDCTPADIREMIELAWNEGVKCVAFYRDGSKSYQPLVVVKDDLDEAVTKMETLIAKPGEMIPIEDAKSLIPVGDARRKMPTTRNSKTHKFSVGGVDGYLTAGMYEDGTVGEVFVNVSKQGSTVAGLMDAWATSFSLNLQYGVPLRKLCSKFMGTSFEPSGFTGGEEVKVATSLVDYVCQWLMVMCTPTIVVVQGGDPKDWVWVEPEGSWVEPEVASAPKPLSGRTCTNCGGLMAQTGTCQTCTQCGESSGGCG